MPVAVGALDEQADHQSQHGGGAIEQFDALQMFQMELVLGMLLEPLGVRQCGGREALNGKETKNAERGRGSGSSSPPS
ncbi:MAG: hypothetical protein RLZZ117_1874 [Cyanobacteriota bacterium]